MSRRSDRASRAREERLPRGAAAAGEGAPARESRGPSWGLATQLAFLAAVFAVVTVIAELAGAANLGVALGIGQIAFAIAVVFLLVRR